MLYLYCPDQAGFYVQMLRERLPGWRIACWPEAVAADEVTHVAAWGAPTGFFASFRNLRVVFNLGAGVDSLLRRDDIAERVAIVRLTDAGMAQQMIEYCLYGVLHYQRDLDIYRRQQHAGQWLPRDARPAASVRVSVLGLGELGRKVAGELTRFGYCVRGWSRRARVVDGVDCRNG